MSVPSTYLLMPLQIFGENPNNWGDVCNDDIFTVLEEKLCKLSSIATTGGTFSLSQAQETSAILRFTGVLASNAIVEFSGRQQFWFVINDTTGAFTLTTRVTGQTGVVIPQGAARTIYSNGADIFDNISGLNPSGGTITGSLTINNDLVVGDDSSFGDIVTISPSTTNLSPLNIVVPNGSSATGTAISLDGQTNDEFTVISFLSSADDGRIGFGNNGIFFMDDPTDTAGQFSYNVNTKVLSASTISGVNVTASNAIAGGTFTGTTISGTSITASTGTTSPNLTLSGVSSFNLAHNGSNVRTLNLGTGQAVTADTTASTITLLGTNGTSVTCNGANATVSMARAGAAATLANQFNISGIGIELLNSSFAQKTSGTAWSVSSDYRIKDVIGDYEAGLNEITRLRPIKYVLKDGAEKVDYGLVAQEAMDVMPEMVSVRPGKVGDIELDDMHFLDVSSMTFAFINAIKELKMHNDSLEARIKVLENG